MLRRLPSSGELSNLARDLLDPWAKEGERIALWDDEGAMVYGELIEASHRAGRGFLRAGVTPGDRILLVLFDGRAFASALWGALRVGAVFAMANPRSDQDALAKLIAYTQPKVILTEAELVEKVRKAQRLASFSGKSFSLGQDWEPWCAEGQGKAEVATEGDDPAGWLFTSGTSTGGPRAAIHSHRSFAHATAQYAQGVLGLCPEDVCLSVPRLHFGYGTGTSLIFPGATGASAVLFRGKPTASRILGAAKQHQATVLASVPTVMGQLLTEAETPENRDCLASLRLCISAGEALPRAMAKRWEKRFSGIPVLDGLGAAETFHIVLSQRPGEDDGGTLGRLVDGYEAKVMDDNGAPVAAGTVGRLWIRGASIASGYWGAPGRSAETFVDGWYRSADLVSRRSDGRYIYAGRVGDVIKVKGQFLALREVEDCLGEHPGVAECAVVASTRDDGLLRVSAHVVASASENELRRHCAARLGKHKVPERFCFSRALPRNDRGKVLRRLLLLHPMDAQPARDVL